MNLEKCMNILKDFTNQNLTTKELSELGITKHFISKLMERGKLERIKRGTYTVKTLKNMKNRKSFFAIRDFCESTDLGYYSQAYYNLMRAYNIKTDNKSDNVIRVGFTLLQEILEKGDVLSSLNNLEDLTLENKPNSEYWNKFCESVINKDYITAKENIELSAAAQMGEQGFVGEVTKAMCDLVNKFISIKEDRTKLQEYSEKINSLIMENKYEEAIQYGEESIEHISDESLKESLNSLIELIKTVIAFKEDKEKTLNNQKMAIYGNDKPSVLLALYLRDKNYLSALKYISNVCAKKTNFYLSIIHI
ncbi:MAG: type IV toxin-antitoxin system AbiEi family antitoxin domain-containing protein, partial [Bacilli bacterium]|nr:type IV toxin-antitoxin system AbiEi family antitoxin domain-containing protein [Bacilli bacterium]